MANVKISALAELTDGAGADTMYIVDDSEAVSEKSKYITLSNLADYFEEQVLPAGVVMAWTTDTAPSGWLECDGSAVNRSTYSALFSAISDDYGSGDGSTTFNLPDYRGYFLRGYDNSAGNDPDAATRTDRGDGTTGDDVGTAQASQNKAHTHNVPGAAGGSGYSTVDRRTDGRTWSPATDSSGGSEARPINKYVMWIIKT
jgi:microcystin-dependent protein